MFQSRLSGGLGSAVSRCQMCGRPLKDPRSVERGMGPVCGGKNAASDSEDGRPYDRFINHPVSDCILMERRGGGVPYTNVPHFIQRHSPDGYEWGYGGSGPSELALNCVEAILRAAEYGGEIVLDGKARRFRDTNLVYQDFKWEFIATMPPEGGRIDSVKAYSANTIRLEGTTTTRPSCGLTRGSTPGTLSGHGCT